MRRILKSKKGQNLKKMVELKLGTNVTDEEFMQGFELAFNKAEHERRFNHGFKFN